MTDRAIAFHETGHAVSYWALGLPLGEVSIVPDARSSGRAAFARDPNEADLRREAIAIVAGGVEQHQFAPGYHLGDLKDISEARDIVVRLLGSDYNAETWAAEFCQFKKEAKSLLLEYRRRVELFAEC